MKNFKKIFAICAVVLVMSSLSAVPTFAASGNVLDQLEAVQDPETGKIVHVFSEDVPEIRGNSKGITATPVLRPDLRTPTDTQMIFDENEKTTENTQPTATEVIEAVQNMMRSIAFEKENYGLASADLSKIKLTSKIPAYEVREEGLVPLDTMDFYAITDESGTIVMMISASSEEGETHVSTSGSLVSELLKYQQAHKEVALLYDDMGVYCWDGTSTTLLENNHVQGGIPGRARLSTIKLEEYSNIKTTQLSPIVEIGIASDIPAPIGYEDETAYVNPPVKRQPSGSGWCWAACMASIVQFESKGSYSCQEMANRYTSDFSDGCTVSDASYRFSKDFGLNFQHESTGYINFLFNSLGRGHAVYGDFRGSWTYHAMVIRGIDFNANTFSVMDPEATGQSYRSGYIINPYGNRGTLQIDSFNGAVTYKLNSYLYL